MKQEYPSIVVGLGVGDRVSHVYAMEYDSGEILGWPGPRLVIPLGALSSFPDAVEHRSTRPASTVPGKSHRGASFAMSLRPSPSMSSMAARA